MGTCSVLIWQNESIWYIYFLLDFHTKHRSFVCLFQSNGRACRHTKLMLALKVEKQFCEFQLIIMSFNAKMKKCKLLLWKKKGEICPVKLKLSSTRRNTTKMIFGSSYRKYADTCTVSFCLVRWKKFGLRNILMKFLNFSWCKGYVASLQNGI